MERTYCRAGTSCATRRCWLEPAFRGFRGTYEVEATSNGRTVKRQFAVGNAALGPVEIVVA